MLFRLADRNSTASKELYETFIFSFARYFALSLAVLAQEMSGLQFNGVEIATTEAEVIQKLGKPSSRKRSAGNECQGSLLKLRYPGLMIEIESSGGTSVVAAATVTSPKRSVSGIRIGASVS